MPGFRIACLAGAEELDFERDHVRLDLGLAGAILLRHPFLSSLHHQALLVTDTVCSSSDTSYRVWFLHTEHDFQRKLHKLAPHEHYRASSGAWKSLQMPIDAQYHGV